MSVFAYPGGASMPIHQALTRVNDRLRTILPRHEQGGGFAAEGYARTTGKVGVCVATSGPGATNFVTCLADAKMDSDAASSPSPARSAPPSSAPTPFRKRRSSRSAGPSPSIIISFTRTEDITRVFKEAFHIATTGRPGPVIVDVPKDVQNNADRARLGSADEPARLQALSPGHRGRTAKAAGDGAQEP